MNAPRKDTKLHAPRKDTELCTWGQVTWYTTRNSLATVIYADSHQQWLAGRLEPVAYLLQDEINRSNK